MICNVYECGNKAKISYNIDLDDGYDGTLKVTIHLCGDHDVCIACTGYEWNSVVF